MRSRSGGTPDVETGQITEATTYGSSGHGAVKSAARVLQVFEFFNEIQRDRHTPPPA